MNSFEAKKGSVADPDHIDTGPDPAFHFDLDPDPSFHFYLDLNYTDPDPYRFKEVMYQKQYFLHI